MDGLAAAGREESIQRSRAKGCRRGPQEVTVRGRRTAIVVSAEEYDRLQGSKPGFVDALLSGPDWDDELVRVINDRPKWAPRDVDF